MTHAIGLAGLLLGLCACDATIIQANAANAAGGASTAPEETPRPGYVTGTVRDTHGQPVAGARILLENSVFHASYIHGSSQQDGHYRLKVQPGAWRAQASIKRTYHGRTYTLDLAPDSIDSLDEEGGVRHFTWKLEGRRPESDYAYYGGFIQLSMDTEFSGDLQDVELTLTPAGPLIDGSPGKTLRLRPGDHYWVDRFQVEDVPIGRYLIQATLKGKTGGGRRLRIQDWHARGEFQHDFQLDFIPKPSSGTNNSASIVIGD